MGQIASCLRTRPLPICPQEDSLLMQQPLDILFSICIHLPEEDVISFSLGCKSLHLHLFPNIDRRRAIDEIDLLVRLERDIPNRLFCFRCKKLHCIDQRRGTVKKDCFFPRCNFWHWGAPEDPFMLDDLGLSFNQARAIMNNHFLGPDYGIHVEKLCQQIRPRTACSISESGLYQGRSRKYYMESQQTAIIEDELFFSRTRTIYSPPGDYHDLLAVIAALSYFKPCDHVYGRFEQLLTPDIKRDGFGSAPGSCGTCLTDWEAEIHYEDNLNEKGAAGGWKLSLVCFHQLGGCRSPQDWKWANLKQNPYRVARENIQQRGHMHNHRPGSVRRKWMLGVAGPPNELIPAATVFFPESWIPEITFNGSEGL